jgi:ferric-dicitrate binding protein FerR (iron transport regulator)
MSSSSGGSSANQLITSEQVLEKLFRAGYARWVEDARKRLGAEAASSAPRVVSKVFHLAWTDRARFHTQDELDAFLGANIQHQSARELSRKASAQHLAHKTDDHKDHGKEISMDEAWERLKGTLQGGAPEAYRQRASTARHEAADHMKNIGQEKFNWKPMAAIGLIGVAVAVGALAYISKAGEDRAVQHALNAQDARPYESSYGQQMKITLDDSTIVRLGPESKLIVPKLFGLGLRAVQINGTANFEVTRTMDQPFDVRVSGIIILAKGTEFTVRYFKDDAAIVVHARKGALEVKAGENVRQVAEGIALRIAPSGEMSAPSSEELAEASSWVDGTASILNRELRDALPLLKRWYGIEIHVPNADLMSRKVYVSADIQSRNAAIKAIEQSGGLKFGYVGENMVFQDTLPSKGRTKKK